MLFKSVSNALNLRSQPNDGGSSSVIGELRFGDLVDVKIDKNNHADPFIQGTVKTGLEAGRIGYVRRKWIAQELESPVAERFDDKDRLVAASIIASRTKEFDAVTYHMPKKKEKKADSWNQLSKSGWTDCSGWVYLLAAEILSSYASKSPSKALWTVSDSQITVAALATRAVVSGDDLKDDHFLPGVILGIDFSEYSWDRGRALDIDHIVMIGEDAAGRFISQSSSKGGGVNRVPLTKWLASTDHLRKAWRIHAVDLLSAP